MPEKRRWEELRQNGLHLDKKRNKKRKNKDTNGSSQLHPPQQPSKKQKITSTPLQQLNAAKPETLPRINVPLTNQNAPLNASSSLPALPDIASEHWAKRVFVHKTVEGDDENYEKLEFAGDAYVELIATNLILSRFPNYTSGQLAQLREWMVKNETLAGFSRRYGFEKRLIDKNNGLPRNEITVTKIMGDLFEAYVAAVVLSDPENGYKTVETWLTELWTPKLLECPGVLVINADAKSDLARLVYTTGGKVKVQYKQERPVKVVDGIQEYLVGCYFTGWGYEDKYLGSGGGQSINQAGSNAAAHALEKEKKFLDWCHEKKVENDAAVYQNKNGESRNGKADK